MKLYNIVLTGGPGAGKTTILNSIKEKLNDLGYTTFIVPETARSFIESGIKPSDELDYTIKFQDSILKQQELRERITLKFANLSKSKDVIIIYDRAIMDNCAYFDDVKDFKKIMKDNNLNEIDTIQKYDLVLDLISPASCYQNIYMNDSGRLESIEQARIRDEKTSNAWLLNRNLKIILPTETIEEKENIVMKHIMDLLNNKITLNKCTYSLNPKKIKNIFNQINNDTSKVVSVSRIYLNSDKPDYVFRLTKMEYENKCFYFKEEYQEIDSEYINYDFKKLDECEYDKIIHSTLPIKYESGLEISFIKNFKLYKLYLNGNNSYIEEYSNIYQNEKNLVKKLNM